LTDLFLKTVKLQRQTPMRIRQDNEQRD